MPPSRVASLTNSDILQALVFNATQLTSLLLHEAQQMKLHYLNANSHLFPRIPLQAFPRYLNGACRDLCSPYPWPAYRTWTDANQSTASHYPDNPFVEQPCSTSPWTAYRPRTDATQNTASYYQDDPLVKQRCLCADSSAEAYQTHAYYDDYSLASVPESMHPVSPYYPENAAAYHVPGTFSNTTRQPVAKVSQTNVNFAHSPYCLPSGEAHGPQHPEPQPRLPSPTCSAAPGLPIVTRLADQLATLHRCLPPPGSYMLQGITIRSVPVVESSRRLPESPALDAVVAAPLHDLLVHVAQMARLVSPPSLRPTSSKRLLTSQHPT